MCIILTVVTVLSLIPEQTTKIMVTLVYQQDNQNIDINQKLTQLKHKRAISSFLDIIVIQHGPTTIKHKYI